MIERYSKYLESYKKSQNTIKNYIRIYEHFLVWLKSSEHSSDVKTISHVIIRDYLNFLDANHAAPATRNQTIFALKSFYNWLIDEEMTAIENPVSKIKHIPVKKRAPTYISLDNMSIIFDAMGVRNYYRNKSIIICASIGGLRVSEIVNLKLIDFKLGVLHVIGKGDKERFVPLSSEAISIINKYINKYRPKTNSDFLFIAEQTNDKLSVRAVEMFMTGLAHKTGQQIYPHKLRHTAATLAYAQTKDILAVKELLGHVSLSTTEIYTHALIEHTQALVDSNPINDLL